MGNILDYLDWRGDLTFEQTPFNQVDNLILACFSYLDLDEIADVKNGNTLSVEELFEIFSGKEKDGEVKAESAFLQNTPILLEKMAAQKDFENAGQEDMLMRSFSGKRSSFRQLQWNFLTELHIFLFVERTIPL